MPIAGVLVLLGVCAWLYRSPPPIRRVFGVPRATPTATWAPALWLWPSIGVFAATWALRVVNVGAALAAAPPEGLVGVMGWLTLIALFAAEFVVATYGLMHLRYGALAAAQTDDPGPVGTARAEVLVLIPCCDEPEAVLRRSMGSARALKARVVAVDNSRTEAGRRAAASVGAELGVEVLVVANRGHKAGALNDALAVIQSPAPLVAVFDADQLIDPRFLDELVPRLLSYPGLAFVQSAQVYGNDGDSLVCRAAAQQEILLYDWVLIAKGSLGRAPCCGTNFVMRRQALDEVGGFDESVLIEDQATSYAMFAKGWRSAYLRRALAVGLGPADLEGASRQQARWAEGAVTLSVRALRDGLAGRIPIGLAVDTAWSGAFYALTPVLAALSTLPVALALALPEVPSRWGFSVYLPYAMVVAFPYLFLRLRGYRLRELVLVQGLLAVMAPVHLRAVFRALFRQPGRFEVTPKGRAPPGRSWWWAPQSWAVAALLAGGSVAVGALLDRPAHHPGVVSGWALFYGVCLGHYFLFRLDRPRPTADDGPWPLEP